jgi:hypothetical protein
LNAGKEKEPPSKFRVVQNCKVEVPQKHTIKFDTKTALAVFYALTA